ncbi:MAG: dethiobiotin synthase [Flavobacterium sp.]|nr:MAG: dethiobiotin synthase [Flavobacterium sp.]
MKTNYFITGISTEVGKTVVSAVVTEALQADYWKPIQAGDLHNTDTDKVRRWISNKKSVIHNSAYNLSTPMSPHAAAEIDKIKIKSSEIKRPVTKNSLVIEGAGGLLVPINTKETIMDLIAKEDKVILVSRHYLGSINHTLLSIEALKAHGKNIFGIIFIGEEHPTTESIIVKMTGAAVLGRIPIEPYIDKHVVSEYAEIFRPAIESELS